MLPEMHYVGSKRTDIKFKSNAWKLEIANSNTTALSKIKLSTYALGKFNWTVANDNADCNPQNMPEIRQLKLTGCREGNFTCNDGQCVKMDERCNQVANCRDKSDERGCQVLLVEEGYNKQVPPIISALKKVFPVPVNVTINLF